MKFLSTRIPGVYIVDVERHVDERGFFARSFCRHEFTSAGLHAEFVQCNISHNSGTGTLRGMHFQRPPYDEVKLVRCTSGAIYDVVVDLRSQSPAFGSSFGIDLTAESQRMIYIPAGLAHGFLTLRDNTDVFYQMGNFYHPASADGFRWNDAAFQITWPMPPQTVSTRDAHYEDFDLARMDNVFPYDGK